MAKPRVGAGGGLASILYSLKKSREADGIFKMARRMRSRNACKTCAFGMGGQLGGMVNEQRKFPEVCKKSLQAQAGDMQKPIPAEFFSEHPVEELEQWSSMQLEYAGRLAFPVMWREGETHFNRIDWDEALDTLATALEATAPHETFFYASGRSSNEAAFLLQTFARAYGCSNIHNCSYYCHNASGVALSRLVGSGTATVVIDDLDKADLALVAGANPASNHPRMISKLVELRKRGGTVIIVNPMKELGLVRFRIPSQTMSLLFGSDVCDIYLQPHVGTDVAVFKALLKGVIEAGAANDGFLAERVEGWEAVERDIRSTPWETLLESCGVSRSEIDRAATAIAKASNGILLWAMGLTHHANGVNNIAALANIALARGWLGGEGRGLLPIRGHSNVQGVGSVGFAPELKEAFAKKMEETYGIPTEPNGLDTYGSMLAAEEGRIQAAVLLGGNLWGSNPDLDWAGAVMQNIGTTAHITTKLNPGHVHGRGRVNLLLPVLARDEEKQATTQESMFNYVRLSDGGAPPPGDEVKSEVEVIAGLAARVLPPGPFPFEKMNDHRAIREVIAEVVPGYEAMKSIDSGGNEFYIDGRTFHEPSFNTPTGRARARVTPLPDLDVKEDEFRLMTLRSEGQFNTVVYEEEDLYRGNTRRDVVMMNGDDAERLGLSEGDPVTVTTETGRLDVVTAIVDLPPGNLAMYYPEANVLVPRRIDPESGTPAFKSVIARVVTGAQRQSVSEGVLTEASLSAASSGTGGTGT